MSAQKFLYWKYTFRRGERKFVMLFYDKVKEEEISSSLSFHSWLVVVVHLFFVSFVKLFF